MVTEVEVGLRVRTQEQLFDHIVSRPGCTRRELAEWAGASRSAVAAATARLLDAGRIVERTAPPAGAGSGSGRPAARLYPTTADASVLALDFGHDHISVALADGAGRIVVESRTGFDVDADATASMTRAHDLVAELLRGGAVPPLRAAVAGIPGPVDRHNGMVVSPTILSGWVGRHPARELGTLLGVSVHVENDAVLGAKGEHREGAGTGHDSLVYVKASGGIGAALIIDGRPFTGVTGIAGEIGHTELAGHVDLCRCGKRGCLEAVVSVDALRRQLRHTHPDCPEPDLLHLRDTISRRVFDEAGRTLGTLLAVVADLLNPGAVVIGGELSNQSAFVDGVRTAIDRAGQPVITQALEIAPARLGQRAELVGAAHLAAERLASSRPARR